MRGAGACGDVCTDRQDVNETSPVSARNRSGSARAPDFAELADIARANRSVRAPSRKSRSSVILALTKSPEALMSSISAARRCQQIVDHLRKGGRSIESTLRR